MSEPWSSMQRSKRTTKTTLRSAWRGLLKKRVDRADIVRDFRLEGMRRWLTTKHENRVQRACSVDAGQSVLQKSTGLRKPEISPGGSLRELRASGISAAGSNACKTAQVCQRAAWPLQEGTADWNCSQPSSRRDRCPRSLFPTSSNRLPALLVTGSGDRTRTQ